MEFYLPHTGMFCFETIAAASHGSKSFQINLLRSVLEMEHAKRRFVPF